jgi:hypothetical protein
MEVGVYLVADAQAFELVEPGEGPLDDPAGLAQAGAVWGATAGDLGSDAASADDAAVFVEVVAAVGEEPLGSAPRSAAQSADGWYRVQQRDELGDVVAVSAGQRDGERGAVSVGDEVVLAAGTGPVDRRRSGVSPPLRALTCEASIAASSMSKRPAARSSVRRTSCSRGQTPASVQSRSRRQQVTPLQPVCSAGTSRQLTPLHNT